MWIPMFMIALAVTAFVLDQVIGGSQSTHANVYSIGELVDLFSAGWSTQLTTTLVYDGYNDAVPYVEAMLNLPASYSFALTSLILMFLHKINVFHKTSLGLITDNSSKKAPSKPKKTTGSQHLNRRVSRVSSSDDGLARLIDTSETSSEIRKRIGATRSSR